MGNTTATGAVDIVETGSGFGIRSISCNLEDRSFFLWLHRSTIGRWRVVTNPLCIQEEALAGGIEVSVVFVGNVYGLISFKSSSIRDCVLKNNSDWFSKRFLDVKPWEAFDLASSSHRWVCLKGVSLPYWHDKFFVFVSTEFG